MESRSSIASNGSRTIRVKGSETTLVNQGKEGASTLVPFTPDVAKDTPEEDPFLVKLHPSDPSHPEVRTPRNFSVLEPD